MNHPIIPFIAYALGLVIAEVVRGRRHRKALAAAEKAAWQAGVVEGGSAMLLLAIDPGIAACRVTNIGYGEAVVDVDTFRKALEASKPAEPRITISNPGVIQ